MLKQIYAHYEHWEDFKAGMYLTEAVEVNLSNTNCNRRAWLGQAACCYRFSVPGFCSRCLS
jgi:hypothetical protein